MKLSLSLVVKCIDTPVKRYSSGMRVRLGFAVAAHLEPEILVVDEVLAVGDAEFQKKAIGKMQDLSSGEGRTVLFVSHNMASVQNLCTRGIVLENGETFFEGSIGEAISNYLSDNRSNLAFNYDNSNSNYIKHLRVVNSDSNNILLSGDKMIFEITVNLEKLSNPNIHIGLYDSRSEKIIHLSSEFSPRELLVKKSPHRCIINKNPLAEGRYSVNVLLLDGKEKIEHIADVLKIEILKGDFYNQGILYENIPSKFLIDHKWE